MIDLVNTRSISHLASVKGGRHLFRITVGEGERLTVQTEGGKGKSMLAVLFGSVPPEGKPVKGEPTRRHPSRVVIPEGLIVGEDPELDARRFRRSENGICLITQTMIDKLEL